MKMFIDTFVPAEPEAAGRLVSALLRGYKIVHVKMAVPCEDPAAFYAAAAPAVGSPAVMDEDLQTGDKNGGLFTEIRTDPAHPASYRHSATAQPLHTDGAYEADAPNVTFFYCLRKAEYGGATIFVDSTTLYDMALAESWAMALRLQDPVTFVKGTDSKTRPIVANDMTLTWNYHRVQDHTDATRWFHSFLEEKVVKGGVCHPVLLDRGDAVFFRDELLLHGRYGYIGKRHLVKGGLRVNF